MMLMLKNQQNKILHCPSKVLVTHKITTVTTVFTVITSFQYNQTIFQLFAKQSSKLLVHVKVMVCNITTKCLLSHAAKY